MSRPFFFLCLLEDSSPLSNSGLTFLPLAGAACALRGSRVGDVVDLVRSGRRLFDRRQRRVVGRADRLEAAVRVGINRRRSRRLSRSGLPGLPRAGEDGATISTPIEDPDDPRSGEEAALPAERSGGHCAASLPAAAPAAGTSCSASGAALAGAAGAAAVPGAAAALASVAVAAAAAASRRLGIGIERVGEVRLRLAGDVGREGLLGIGQRRLAHAGGGDDVRLVHDEQTGAVGDAVLGAAVLKRLAGGHLLGGGLGNRHAHGIEPVAGVFHVRRGGVLGTTLL